MADKLWLSNDPDGNGSFRLWMGDDPPTLTPLGWTSCDESMTCEIDEDDMVKLAMYSQIPPLGIECGECAEVTLAISLATR